MEIHAVLPRIHSEIGHFFSYHLAAQKAASLLGWDYFAYTPRKLSLPYLPSNWNPVLANDNILTDNRKLGKIKYFIANIVPFRKIFKSIKKKNNTTIFIEHFEMQHIASICVALIFLKPKFQIWILHRYSLENRKLKSFMHRIFLFYLSRKLGVNRVKCLTDSDLLAESLQGDLRYPVQVLPIPHTDSYETVVQERSREMMTFWWPGGAIREEKGMVIIQKLLNLSKSSGNTKIVVADCSAEVFGTHSNLQYIPTFLSRAEYINWMCSSDLVLLPYLQKDYSMRTSGIFVEAISLGATPVTTKGTWMAHELEKFGLTELIFDWEEQGIIHQLSELTHNQRVKEKIQLMKTEYLNFHSVEGFSRALQNL